MNKRFINLLASGLPLEECVDEIIRRPVVVFEKKLFFEVIDHNTLVISSDDQQLEKRELVGAELFLLQQLANIQFQEFLKETGRELKATDVKENDS